MTKLYCIFKTDTATGSCYPLEVDSKGNTSTEVETLARRVMVHESMPRNTGLVFLPAETETKLYQNWVRRASNTPDPRVPPNLGIMVFSGVMVELLLNYSTVLESVVGWKGSRGRNNREIDRVLELVEIDMPDDVHPGDTLDQADKAIRSAVYGAFGHTPMIPAHVSSVRCVRELYRLIVEVKFTGNNVKGGDWLQNRWSQAVDMLRKQGIMVKTERAEKPRGAGLLLARWSLVVDES